MKTANEIRKYRDDLRKAKTIRCDCSNRNHARDCVEGALMMAAVEQALSWVLDEDPETDRMVEHIAAAVARIG